MSCALANHPRALARLDHQVGPGVWQSMCLERRLPEATPAAPKARMWAPAQAILTAPAVLA